TAVAALRHLRRPAVEILGFRARHAFARQRRLVRRRTWGIVERGVRRDVGEVDVLGERRHHVVGTDAIGNAAVVAKIEARSAVQAALGQPRDLLVLGALALDRDAVVLALAAFTQLVELALEMPAAIAIVLVLD